MTLVPWISTELVFPLIRTKIQNCEKFSVGSIIAVSVSPTLPCVGTLCRVCSGSIVEGIERIRLETGMDRSVRYTKIPDAENLDQKSVDELVNEILKKMKLLMKEHFVAFPKNSSAEYIGYSVMKILLRIFAKSTGCISVEMEGQSVLEHVSLLPRLQMINESLDRCIESFKISISIREKNNSEMKQILIRRQIAELQKQLPKETGSLKLLGGTGEILKIFQNESKKLQNLQSHHPEYHVILNYLETLTSLPFESKQEIVDIQFAKRILSKSHFGLEKVKLRILEFIVLMQRVGPLNAPIICLTGAPGLGKTSIASSSAEAMGRKFARVSLGGIRDESELRGHRKTYIGAMPGLIIQALIRSGSTNPVILLDEIDKIGIRGLGVLLEILDPTQNSSFRDAYLNFGFDLSKCVFICTCNDPSLISPPLMDRMELIEIQAYSDREKLEIAKNFLIPKNLKSHQIDFSFPDNLIEQIITAYTMEAGVRDLDRRIAQILRYVILNEKKNFDLLDIFGPPSVISGPSIPSVLPVGVSLGLAVSPLGGEVLFIEAMKTKGRKLVLTGQLGEVMQESVRIALSLLCHDDENIHIHFPSGGIKKDGPSAGVATWIALASLFTNIAVSGNLAATGEITLRGAVLPVGGVKGKILAAHRAGIKTVIIPEGNKNCLLEVPTKILDELHVVVVSNIKQVWDIAFPENTFISAKL